jgi:hypothetical protein
LLLLISYSVRNDTVVLRSVLRNSKSWNCSMFGCLRHP